MPQDDLRSVNPYTGETLAVFPQDSDAEVAAKLSASARAFESWKHVPLSDRCRLVARLSDILIERVEDIGLLMSREIGKPIRQAKAEVHKCAWLCRHYAAEASAVLAPRVVETDASRSMVRYRPLGPVLAVMPWNFPFWQVFRCMVPALSAGNTVVLKHASNATMSALAIRDCLMAAGYPPDLLQILMISGQKAESLPANPFVKAVALTGSNAAGAAIGRVAGAVGKPIVLELGGSNAFIVMDDVDLGRAARDAVTGRFQNNGQSCIAAKRILVHQDVFDAFIQLFTEEVKTLQTGNPTEDSTDIGPLAKEEFAIELEETIAQDAALGARVLLGGKREGAMLTPTIVSDVTSVMRLWREETFGPVAVVRAFADWEEAVSLSNDSQFGLGVSVYTADAERALEADFQEGAVFVNSIVKSDPRLPFGGVKASGVGRELGPEGLLSFVNVQTVYVA